VNRLLLLLALPALAGCSLNRAAARATSGVIDTGLEAVYSQADAEYARQALPANLQLMEILLRSDPANKKLLVNAAQGFCGYALMFVEDEDAARAAGFYRKGEDYAARALGARPPEKAAAAEVPALFWNTYCKASRLNVSRDDPEALAGLPELEPAMRRLLELDPKYYYNGPEALLGAYYAMRPRMFGGDPARAAQHFERAITGAGEAFLFNRYFYASMAAVALQDADLFEKLLKEVTEAGPSPEAHRLPDEAARAKARRLLEKKDELF
jgi:hypothetical protein